MIYYPLNLLRTVCRAVTRVYGAWVKMMHKKRWAALVLAALLWTLYFWMYLRFTPAGCLPPEQWTGFWRAVP